MTNRLGKESEVWQAHGENYIARELRRLESIAKQGGAPEEFEDMAATGTSYDYHPTALQILKALAVEGNKSTSTVSVVDQYNAYLGSRLPAEINPADLILTKEKLETIEDRRLILSVGIELLYNYNAPLRLASKRRKFDTIGKIREADPEEIIAIMGVGPRSAPILLHGFTRDNGYLR